MSLFRSYQNNLEFAQNGFVVLPFLSNNRLVALESIFNENYLEETRNSGDFFYSLMSADTAKKKEAARQISALIIDECDKNFSDIKIYFESFLVKPPGYGDMSLHQDWSHVDEAKSEIATLWCPLEQTTLANGTFYAIKGSHRFFKNVRSESYPTSRIEVTDELREYITTVEVPKGHALFFHPALWHGSYPNTTKHNRIIVTALITEKAATLHYYNRQNEKISLCYEMKEDYLFHELKNLAQGAGPDGYKACYEREYSHHHISSNQMRAALAAFQTL